MPGLDKHMLILLINKLKIDGYLQLWKEEEDNLETFELVAKEEEKKKLITTNTPIIHKNQLCLFINFYFCLFVDKMEKYIYILLIL